MDIKEMKRLIKEIEDKAAMEIRHVKIAFAKENNSVNIGDIVIDHCKKIKVTNIKYSLGVSLNDMPCCVYYGILLKKDNTPKKNQDTGDCVYQTNIVEHIKA